MLLVRLRQLLWYPRYSRVGVRESSPSPSLISAWAHRAKRPGPLSPLLRDRCLYRSQYKIFACFACQKGLLHRSGAPTSTSAYYQVRLSCCFPTPRIRAFLTALCVRGEYYAVIQSSDFVVRICATFSAPAVPLYRHACSPPNGSTRGQIKAPCELGL